MVITRKERERLVLDLYNQGKTIREIAKEARMSFRDIRRTATVISFCSSLQTLF
jgi:cytidylate kinase